MHEPLICRNDDAGYVSCLEHQQSNGFVLNLVPAGSEQTPMLHAAWCTHLFYPLATYTHAVKRPKACSEDRETLERWAQAHGRTFVLCSSCGASRK